MFEIWAKESKKKISVGKKNRAFSDEIEKSKNQPVNFLRRWKLHYLKHENIRRQ
jgi:hypothetical protein